MRYWIITVLSLPGFLAEAQKMDMPLAEKLLEKELAFFVSGSDTEKAAILFEKAGLHTANADYEKALSELDRAAAFVTSDDSRLKYEQMLNYFLSGRFSRSAHIALSDQELLRIHKRSEYHTMRFTSLNENEQWEQCRSELLNYCSGCDSLQMRKIASLPILYPYISPLKCRILSGIVPGLGMAKAGKPLKGATSFLLQSGLAFGAGYCFYAGYYVAGTVSGIFPLLKFHKGGVRLSGLLADERNENEKLKLKALYAEQIKKVVHR